MVALDPDNMKWRMEQQSADTNLGVLLFYQRRFGEATAQFTRAFRNIDALATADPENSDYQKALTEAEAWLADGQASQGHLAEAAALGEQHAALLSRLLVRTGDVEYRQNSSRPSATSALCMLGAAKIRKRSSTCAPPLVTRKP